MPKSNKICDVFIANSPIHAALATDIAEVCHASGLEATTNAELPPELDNSDELWEALAESRALVVILPPDGPTDSMWIEIGAVRAWNKPILGVVTNPSLHPPSPLSDIKWFVPSRLDELVNAIKSMDRGFSEADSSIIAKVYEEIGKPVDQLILDPRLRQQLARRFKMRAQKSVTEERLLSELLRLRKQGRLKKSRAGSGTKPPVEST